MRGRGFDRWVEGVHVSSVANWGYGDNFKPVHFLFYEKIFSVKKSHQKSHQKAWKSPKPKNKQLLPCLKFLFVQKMLPLLFFVFIFLFYWLNFACGVFYAHDFFVKKVNRLEIASITSIYHTTLLHLLNFLTLLYSSFPNVPFLKNEWKNSIRLRLFLFSLY